MALGRLITLDAHGTLVELERPGALLAMQLRARGVAVGELVATRALAEEIAFYRAHHRLGADRASLARLRGRCTDVLRAALVRRGVGLGGLGRDELLAALLGALVFRPFDDVVPALGGLRAAGHRLVVVSDWDVSLHEMLARTGLAGLVDGAVSSAEAGASKPAAEIFRRAIALAGGEDRAADALHVGDSLELDVAGARAAGMRPVLLARSRAPRCVPPGVAVIASLRELVALAA